MARYTRIFVLEAGEISIIRDSDGNRVTFESLENLSRCSGIDFSGKFSISYEPELGTNGFFRDSEDPSVSEAMIPYQPYENLISNIAILQARKDDITYGLSGQELIDAQAQVAEEQAEDLRLTELVQEAEGDNLVKITKDQIDAMLDTVFDPTDFMAAADFAELKTALGQFFARLKEMERKVMIRVAKLG